MSFSSVPVLLTSQQGQTSGSAGSTILPHQSRSSPDSVSPVHSKSPLLFLAGNSLPISIRSVSYPSTPEKVAILPFGFGRQSGIPIPVNAGTPETSEGATALESTLGILRCVVDPARSQAVSVSDGVIVEKGGVQSSIAVLGGIVCQKNDLRCVVTALRVQRTDGDDPDADTDEIECVGIGGTKCEEETSGQIRMVNVSNASPEFGDEVRVVISGGPRCFVGMLRVDAETLEAVPVWSIPMDEDFEQQMLTSVIDAQFVQINGSIVVAGKERMLLWDVQKQKQIREWHTQPRVDMSRIAVVDNVVEEKSLLFGNVCAVSTAQHVSLWDLRESPEVRITRIPCECSCLTSALRHGRLYGGADNGGLFIFDLRMPIRRLWGRSSHSDAISAQVEVLGDERFVSASEDRTVRLWSRRGKQLRCWRMNREVNVIRQFEKELDLKFRMHERVDATRQLELAIDLCLADTLLGRTLRETLSVVRLDCSEASEPFVIYRSLLVRPSEDPSLVLEGCGSHADNEVLLRLLLGSDDVPDDVNVIVDLWKIFNLLGMASRCSLLVKRIQGSPKFVEFVRDSSDPSLELLWSELDGQVVLRITSFRAIALSHARKLSHLAGEDFSWMSPISLIPVEGSRVYCDLLSLILSSNCTSLLLSFGGVDAIHLLEDQVLELSLLDEDSARAWVDLIHLGEAFFRNLPSVEVLECLSEHLKMYCDHKNASIVERAIDRIEQE